MDERHDMLKTRAPAKINLYLHVTGKRADGFHLLDSLVVFTDIGDELKLEAADAFSFMLEGPMAASLQHEPIEGNLAVRAARELAAALGKPLNVKLTLTKNLPVASGIGGGSSDAAATLRVLAQHWGLAPEEPLLAKIAVGLGQDVPCCLPARTCYFRDIGNVTDAGPDLPCTAIVLVNPNKALPTPAVFKARAGNFTPAARLEKIPQSACELADMLRVRGNDLAEAACQIMPAVRDVLASLDDALLARMSGSGATCFGLYADSATADKAAARLRTAHPDWWVAAGFFPLFG